MSTDQPALQTKCDHRIACERLTLVTDFVPAQGTDPSSSSDMVLTQILSLQQPVAMNGNLELHRLGKLVPESNYSIHESTTRSAIQGVNSTYRYITLTKIDRANLNSYEASYNTSQQFCSKCGGTGFTDDFAQDGHGKPRKVTATQQLAQDVEKFVRTDIGSNKYHNWIGTKLNSLIGKKVVDNSAMVSTIKGYIRDAMKSLQEIQTAHANLNSQVTADEILGDIQSIVVVPDTVDPTVFMVDVVYTARSGKVLTYSVDLATAYQVGDGTSPANMNV